MKKSLALALLWASLLPAPAVVAQPAAKSHTNSRAAVELAGATWHRWPEAQSLAAREGKPILLLQMFGQLDEKWC
jgi:hypothetical protein